MINFVLETSFADLVQALELIEINGYYTYLYEQQQAENSPV